MESLNTEDGVGIECCGMGVKCDHFEPTFIGE